MTDLPQYFSEIPDPRGVSNAQRHSFLELLLIALCAMLSGAETFVDMEDFGVETHLWLRERLGSNCAVASRLTTPLVVSLPCCAPTPFRGRCSSGQRPCISTPRAR